MSTANTEDLVVENIRVMFVREVRIAFENGHAAGLNTAATLLLELANLESEGTHAESFRYAAKLLNTHLGYKRRERAKSEPPEDR